MSRELKSLIRMTVYTAVPVVVALMIQRPAMRQMAWMRVTHGAKTFCQLNADFWQELALKAGTAYNRAKM